MVYEVRRVLAGLALVIAGTAIVAGSNGFALGAPDKVAPPDKVTPQQIKTACQGLGAATWQERQTSFNALVELGMGGRISLTAPRDSMRLLTDRYPEMRDTIATAVIALLQTENDIAAKGAAAMSPQEHTFYSDVVMAVASLHDPRSANALLGAVDTGNMAVAAAATLGNATLKPALAKLNAATNRDDKLDMMVVLMQMAYPHNFAKLANPTSKNELKQALVQATADKDPIIRRSGIEGLRALGDPSTIPILQHIVDTDPEMTGKPGQRQYPIREYARQAISAIEKKAPA